MTEGQSRDRHEVPLSGRLAEFRIALEEEIDAAKRNESSLAVSLINGRRIAQIGGSYQYAFGVENLLNLPGDTPGELYVPGFPSQDVVVVSVEGTTITLGVPQDLGGFVPNARLQSNLTFLLKKLIERIEGLANSSNPVGDRILGVSAVAGSALSLSDLPDVGFGAGRKAVLNQQQLGALASSLGRNATFIWGPPGTGKTVTIGAIGTHLYRRQRSVLLVSHTNAAVDEAVQKIADETDPAELALGRILRVGDPVLGRSLSDTRYRDVLLRTHTDRRSAELAMRREVCETERDRAAEEVLRLSRDVELIEWILEAERDFVVMSKELSQILDVEAAVDVARAEQTSLVARSPGWLTASTAARRAQGALAGIVLLDPRIAGVAEAEASAQLKVTSAGASLAAAENVLAETTSVGWLIRRWRGLPRPERQREVVLRLRGDKDVVERQLAAASELLAALKVSRAELSAEVEAFRRKYSATPEEVLAKAADHFKRVEEVQVKIARLSHEAASRRSVLEATLARRLAVVRELELTSAGVTDAGSMLGAIRQALGKAREQVAGRDLVDLKRQCEHLNAAIRVLDAELQVIKAAQKRVEELVIADAMVVATTLTRAYLRDSIQSRRFDTIILDEASMAAIPAVWVAASMASDNAVVVGDFRQLPPIVISRKELPHRWLGRDVFEVAGLNALEDPTGRRVDLLEQHRMHPQISSIPNELVYGGKLTNARDMASRDEVALRNWYRADWGHDNPVLLVDTGSVNAWVTSVSRGTRASRLNFLSATICVDLAGLLLRQDREKLPDGGRRRILIGCPYRPHAKLLELLVHEEGLAGDVLTGTAHSFQGSEADVVILDLVNDDPHWRVGMFMPERDEANQRLLNVALTRARRRLLVVGDFDYITRLAKKAFIGGKLVPYLLSRYPRVDAKDVVPVGLAARGADAQSMVTGGTLEADAERLILTQDHFYTYLQDDLMKAQRRIVIYSAFSTQDRLGQVGPHLRAAAERGVEVYVVTKARCDRNKSERAQYRRLEETLGEWGVTVIHKRRMHEKLIFIDSEIVWVGSLNPLSFSDTQEIMERRRSRKIAGDYAQTILLEELLAAYRPERPSCPNCGKEVVATEGGRSPFYWTCVAKDCYSRSVGEPPLADGAVVCTKCQGPVEFGGWGENSVWRCTLNPRHRQRITRTHLQLLKMRALVPPDELRRLETMFGTLGTSKRQGAGDVGQMSLFDDL